MLLHGHMPLVLGANILISTSALNLNVTILNNTSGTHAEPEERALRHLPSFAAWRPAAFPSPSRHAEPTDSATEFALPSAPEVLAFLDS